MRYANIVFDGNRRGSYNLGDDLQLVAINHLYKRMGISQEEIVRIPFSELGNYDGEYVILPISFPLYGYRKNMQITQFSDRIIPVFLGLSIMVDTLSKEEISYLKRWEPIGTRDYYTMNVLRNNGIEAYVNGCITLTLTSELFADVCTRCPQKVYIVDVPSEYINYIPNSVLEKAEFCTQIVKNSCSPEDDVKELIRTYYCDAKFVITTRLHCALPCIALGIPVIVMKKHYSFRFSTISKFIPIYTPDRFDQIDWNPTEVKCESFKQVLYDNASGRLASAYDSYMKICEISEFYENHENTYPLYLEHYTNVVEYIEARWGSNRNQSIQYAIWGVTQKSELICKYMEENYPNSKLRVVYDRNKKVSFHGIATTNDEKLLLDSELFVFVTAATANAYAIDLFSTVGKDDYHISTDGVMDVNCQKIEERHNKEYIK